jgi:transcriptional regulator with XRE-family HTH domain
MDISSSMRLRDALSKKGITRTELSQLSGIAKGDITHYLKGDYVPKQDKCYLLAKALDVDPGWLMTGYDPEIEELKKVLESEDFDDIPKTPESRFLAKGMDKMPEALRKAIMTMLEYQYPKFFEEGNEDDDT